MTLKPSRKKPTQWPFFVLTFFTGLSSSYEYQLLQLPSSHSTVHRSNNFEEQTKRQSFHVSLFSAFRRHVCLVPTTYLRILLVKNIKPYALRAITEDANIAQNISPVARNIKLSSFVISRKTMNKDDDSNN